MKKVALPILILVFVFCGQHRDAQYYFDQGAKMFEKAEYDKAIESYQQGLKLEPNSAVGYNLLGMTYRFKYNQSSNAEWRKKEIESFDKALKINPDYMPALVNLGATYYYSGEKQKAVPCLRHALEIYPEHPEAEDIKKMIAEGEAE
jgi:tetratricopeptide (TPR) repeat protein